MTRQPSRTSAGTPPLDSIAPGIRDWHILAGLGLIVLAFFREILFQQAFFWEDFLYQFYPYRNFATVSLARGEIPLWIPYVFMGMPFLADITGTVIYLPHLLLVPLVSAGKLNFWYVELYQVLHTYGAGVAMYYCAKSFGLEKIPSAFAALTYMLSGFLTVHAIHLVMICQAAWFPVAVMQFRKAMHNLSPGAAVLAGVCMFLIICGGHTQIALYYFFFLFCYALYAAVTASGTDRRGALRGLVPRAGLAALMALVALGLSAAQILPTAELSANSLREEMSYARSTEGELSWAQLITLVVPKFFGTSNHLGGENPMMYWGPQSYWNYWETCLYIGIPALALALIAVRVYRSDRQVLFLAGFLLLALLTALGDNFVFHSFFYTIVPGFDKFRAPGRWGFFTAFCGALLAGYGIRGLLSMPAERRRIRLILASIVAVPLLLATGISTGALDTFIASVLRSGSWRGIPVEQALASVRNIASQQSLAGLLFAGAAGFVLFLISRSPGKSAALVGALFVIQCADLYVFGFDQNNGKTNPTSYFDQQRTLIDHLLREGRSEFFRVNARNPQGLLFDRNQGMIDQLFLTEGYTQLALKRRFPPAPSADAMYRLLNVKYRLRTDTLIQAGRGRLRFRLDRDSLYLPRAFMVFSARLCSSAEAESTFMLAPEFDPRHVATLEEPLEGMLDSAAATSLWRAEITAYRNNAISVNVSSAGRGILVLSEMYFPGWNAYIDGAPAAVFRTDWSLRGVVVEQGNHSVEFRYEPRSFALGTVVSGGTALLCLAGAAFSLLRRRRTRPPHTHMTDS
ncbi:MAG: YfhO family protein [Bacteroidota bacterium]